MALRKWAVVVGSDVAGTLTFDDSSTDGLVQRFIAAFDSDPKVIPINTEDPVAFGWFWDGEKFYINTEGN